MEEIIRILMRRDDMSYEDAKSLVEDTKEEIAMAGGAYDNIEDIMLGNLGLEMDYVMDILF